MPLVSCGRRARHRSAGTPSVLVVSVLGIGLVAFHFLHQRRPTLGQRRHVALIVVYHQLRMTPRQWLAKVVPASRLAQGRVHLA